MYLLKVTNKSNISCLDSAAPLVIIRDKTIEMVLPSAYTEINTNRSDLTSPFPKDYL